MTTRVSTPRTVSINGESYRLNAPVHRQPTSQYPQKLILGDVDKDSNPRASVVVWDDWSEGIGLYSTDGREGLNRSSFSRADGRYKNHLTLSPLITNSASHGVAGSAGGMTELGTVIYITLAAASDIYSWTPGADSWSTKLHDITGGAAARQAIAFTLGTTDYIAFAAGSSGYAHSSDGSTWTDDAKNVWAFAYWDDRLWGIDFTGQLWFSTTIGTEVDDAKLQLPDGYAHVLFVGPDAKGEDILYVATEVGLFAHDAANSRFVRTKVTFPRAQATDTSGFAVQGAATWNGDIYISAGGMSVYRYDPVRGIVASVGLDRDAGVPDAGLRGEIMRLLPTHTGLLALVDATDADLVWEYNGKGWHYFTRTDGTKGSQLVSDISGYRFYSHSGGVIKRVDLQLGGVNPDIDTNSYEGTTDQVIHETPWFNAGQNEIDKTAIRARIDCTGMSSTETVKVEYAVDYSSSYNASAFTVTADGVTTNTFPTLANNNVEAGTAFRAIRFKLTLNRGSTATNTPNVKSLSLEWRRKIPVKWGFSIDIDHRERIEGRSPETQLNDLRTAIESGPLVELVYRSRDDNAENYFVDIITAEIIEETGNEFEGVTRLMASEV